ncbi:MAG: malonyl-CoA synthase [Burkholderiales bacterium]|nr:malonyl-CoA synthase [Burkholderiales bacterium]
MPNANLYAALRANFPADLDQIAVETDSGAIYRWRDLDQGAARYANLLASLALPAGSRVAVQVEKSVEAMLFYLGVLRAGYVYLPLNNAYQAAEMGYFIDNARPALVVCAPSAEAWVKPLAESAGAQCVLTLSAQGEGTLVDQARARPDTHQVAEVAASDLAAILYTSGTTGRSKGAMLSHGNLLANAATLKDYWDWQPSDVLIHALPIFHIHGLFVAIHGALIAGARMLWLDKFDPQAVIDRLPRATVMMGVPTMYVRLLANAALNEDACRNMRLFISGSAPMLVETARAFQQRTGHTILERYGMSETGMLTSNPYHEGPAARRIGTVGKPLPGLALRIAPPGGGTCPVGEVGGIEVRGPSVFSGYWQMPEKTAEEFTADGWFKTGDMGRVDDEGYVTIVGRSKDLIITGGFNVYPTEVEDFINNLPGVAESAVIGVPHPDFGEGVVAVVVPKPGAQLAGETMIAALKATIASFKVPKAVFVVDDLPRNVMGKVQKNVLRERYAGVLG